MAAGFSSNQPSTHNLINTLSENSDELIKGVSNLMCCYSLDIPNLNCKVFFVDRGQHFPLQNISCWKAEDEEEGKKKHFHAVKKDYRMFLINQCVDFRKEHCG